MEISTKKKERELQKSPGGNRLSKQHEEKIRKRIVDKIRGGRGTTRGGENGTKKGKRLKQTKKKKKTKIPKTDDFCLNERREQNDQHVKPRRGKKKIMERKDCVVESPSFKGRGTNSKPKRQ